MLDYLFNPASIAVVGASRDPKKVGHAVLNNLIKFNFKGRIYPINPSADEILGIKAYPSVSKTGENIDIVVISIPAKGVPEALIDCARANVKGAVILTAGFREIGHEGRRLEDEIIKIAKDNNIRVLGPNCLGVINTGNNMNATFAADMLPSGRTAFFSQSGALGVAIMDWAIGNNFGFSKFISFGNKADLSEIDFTEYFITDAETDIILGYIEDVVDGKKFMEIAKKATKVKPVILIKSGGTEAGARAASSHTGALAGSDAAFNAVFKQTGIIRAHGIQDLIETAIAFSGRKLPQGNRLLIITNAGGPGILAADMSERLGIQLPRMTKENITSIESLLPSNASLYNPVDIVGDATSERYKIVLEKAIIDPNIDGIVVILTPQAMTDVQNTADIIISTSQVTEKPIIGSFIGDMRVKDASEKLKNSLVPCFGYPEIAVSAFGKLCDYSSWKHSKEWAFSPGTNKKETAKAFIEDLLNTGNYQALEDVAMNILSCYGFEFPERGLARSPKEASAVAERIGFPVVMKISSPEVLHKTDIGGIKINISSDVAAEDAFIEITSNVKRLMPDAFINGVMIYEMIKGGREVILGVTYDRTFGHMIMFGLGGIYVEVLKDVSFRVAPVSHAEAASMINEVKTSALLKGARGEKAYDIDSVIDGIVKLSSFVMDFPIVRELDINPLVVMSRGAFALDARIIFERQTD